MKHTFLVEYEDDPDRTGRILDALIGDHGELYASSPEFNNSVRTIARALPLLVAILAQDAVRLTAARENAVRESLYRNIRTEQP